MVNVDKAFEVKYRKSNEQFEVLVDFDRLKEFQKNSDTISVYDVLCDVKIFKDQKKGELASENIIKKVFPGKNEEEILKEILQKGECQIPTAYLNKLREEKKTQVINYIAENVINPVTKTKYTTSMIESAVNKIKCNFDPQKPFESQAEDILKLLKSQMPISIEKVIIQTKIPAKHVGNFYGSFRKFGVIKKDFYDNQGNLNMEIEITESQKDKVINFIKKNSDNEAEYRII